MFNWQDSYSVKVQMFDEQHKKLFKLINELHQAMKIGQAKTKMGAILEDLLMYTKRHFREEETAMISAGYSEYLLHKQEHDRFTRKVEEFVNAHKAGASAISVELLEFLSGWLTNHIQKTDQRYSACLAM